MTMASQRHGLMLAGLLLIVLVAAAMVLVLRGKPVPPAPPPAIPPWLLQVLITNQYVSAEICREPRWTDGETAEAAEPTPDHTRTTAATESAGQSIGTARPPPD